MREKELNDERVRVSAFLLSLLLSPTTRDPFTLLLKRKEEKGMKERREREYDTLSRTATSIMVGFSLPT